MNHKTLSGYNVGYVINDFSMFMSALNRQGIKDDDVIVICMDKDPAHIQYEIYWP